MAAWGRGCWPPPSLLCGHRLLLSPSTQPTDRCFRRIPAARCVRASRPLISSLTAARKQAEEALRRAHDELETRVQDNLYHKRVRDFEIRHGRNSVTAKDGIGGNNPAPPISKGDL